MNPSIDASSPESVPHAAHAHWNYLYDVWREALRGPESTDLTYEDRMLLIAGCSFAMQVIARLDEEMGR